MFDKFKFACIGATGIIFIASYFFVGLHLNYIDELEKQHNEDVINIENLRDVISIDTDKLCNNNSTSHGSAMPEKTRNQSKLKCYTESELQRKIEKSLDISNECDRLATRFNALLEWCKL